MFGGIHTAEGPKTPLVATTEAIKAILVERLPTVFPGEGKE